MAIILESGLSVASVSMWVWRNEELSYAFTKTLVVNGIEHRTEEMAQHHVVATDLHTKQ